MSATSVVEKATSDMLIGPDWALNLDLCDAINNDPSQAKEIVKAVKKRLTNRNAQVQLLALTVLETLIKNCGDHVHQQVAEKDVLHELVKLVKKKADMRVRDKTLVLLDSWQEAFGGASGRYPQYYMAYSELQKAGVEFPRRGGEPSPPIFTPPQSQPLASPRHGSRSPGTPPSRPVDPENFQGMSLADIKQAQTLVEFLQDMVLALNPRDRMSAKEEVIVELVDQCRVNQHRVMQLVNVSSDEQLLMQGLALNDELQKVLGRYDAFLSGAPIPETSPERKSHSPKVQTQPEAQSSPQAAAAASPGVVPARPRGSARTIFPAMAIPPPPPSGKRPVATSAAVSSAATPAAAPADAAATFDLLSGDPTYQLLSAEATTSQPEASSSTSMALTVIDQPQPKQEQQKVEDLLALPAPDGFSNPFESTPFQATPATTEVASASYPPATPVLRSEPSWGGAPVSPRPPAQSPFYGTPAPEQQQYYQPQPQPLPATTPPPWQEEQPQWQAPSQPSYGYGNNTAWNQQQQQYPGYNTGFATQSSLGQQQAYEAPARMGSVGTGPGENFGTQYLNQRGSAYGQYGTSQQQYGSSGGSKPSVKTPDTLFNDLVDLRSVNAKFKAASLANKSPNTSKAGP